MYHFDAFLSSLFLNSSQIFHFAPTVSSRYYLTGLPSILHNTQISNSRSRALTPFFSLSLQYETMIPILYLQCSTILPMHYKVARTSCSLFWNTQHPTHLINYYSFRYLSCFSRKHSTPESSLTPIA